MRISYRGRKSYVNNIVAQKAGNTTCLFGEFKGKYLPNWQAFGLFKAMRNENAAGVDV